VFLLPARKAGQIAWEPCVRKWLCAAAYRLALRARSATNRRQYVPIGDEDDSPASSDANPLVGIAQQELRSVLDAELHELPEKYRVPVVLCYLEGKTNAEAARLLGWPAGSMSRRLNRARELLGQRLTLRGLALAMLLIALGVGMWTIAGRDPHQPMQVAQLMSRLGQSPDDIARLADSEMDRDRLMRVARKSAELADRISDHQPGHHPEDWKRLAKEMSRSAVVLLDAAENGQEQVVRVAARNLHDSCKNCHAVFRP
jgi:RNA polymerase sigma factor (sigma-70 family)